MFTTDLVSGGIPKRLLASKIVRMPLEASFETVGRKNFNLHLHPRSGNHKGQSCLLKPGYSNLEIWSLDGLARMCRLVCLSSWFFSLKVFSVTQEVSTLAATHWQDFNGNRQRARANLIHLGDVQLSMDENGIQDQLK